MAKEKVFAVLGVNENLMFGSPGGDSLMPLNEINFILAASAKEAIEGVFKAQAEEFNEYIQKVEKLKREGRLKKEIGKPFRELGLFPPSRPVDKEKWRGQEVKIPGYEIILKKL